MAVIKTTASAEPVLTCCHCVQLLKNLEPYIQQGLQKVQELKAEQQQSKEGLDAMIFNYRSAWSPLSPQAKSPNRF